MMLDGNVTRALTRGGAELPWLVQTEFSSEDLPDFALRTWISFGLKRRRFYLQCLAITRNFPPETKRPGDCALWGGTRVEPVLEKGWDSPFTTLCPLPFG